MQILGTKTTPTLPTTLGATKPGTVQATTATQAQQGIIFDQLCDCPPSSRSKLPGIDEATVLTEVEINTATHLRTTRDPLIVRGTAKPGATVRVYNPDIRGWPEVAQVVADASGAYAVKVDDTSKFARGDRVLVTAQEAGKQASGGVMRATVPFTQTTHNHNTFRDGALVNRTSNVTVTPDMVDADDRAPYYDETAVKATTRFERGGLRVELAGNTKAVPPGTKLSVAGATATAGDDGRFSLSIRNAQPGITLDLRLTDIHGRTSSVPVTVRSLRAELDDVVTGTRFLPDGSLHVRAQTRLAAGDTLTLRDASSGALHRLVADAAGKIDTKLSGLTPWTVLEVGVETQGIRGNELSRVVVLPSECGAALHAVSDAACEPTLAKALSSAHLACVDGQDVLVLPEVDQLPAFGRVDILRNGEVLHALRADAKGRTPEVGLADVVPGEVLSLRTYDAAGRRVGLDAPRWMVPATDDARTVVTATRAAESAPLAELVQRLGTGTVAMPATGEGVELRANLVHDPLRLRPAIEKNAASGRTELSGAFPAGTMPEVAGADAYDAVRLAVVDWTTGQRNIVFDLFKGNKLDQQAVRVPLTQADGTLPTVNGQVTLPEAAPTVAMLGRAVGFAALARSLGAGPGEAAYDGPMRAARTLLFALDQVALRSSPAQAEALRAQAAAAVAALPSGADVVDAGRWLPGAGGSGVTPSADAKAFWGAARQKTGLKPWEVLRAG
jgi:hypothetical protein